MNYMDNIIASIYIIMGMLSIIFNKYIGEKTAEFANKQPKWMRLGLKSSIRFNRIGFIGIGFLFAVVGIKLFFK